MIPKDFGLKGGSRLGNFSSASTSPQTSTERVPVAATKGARKAEAMIAAYAQVNCIATGWKNDGF
jgi:hypothetical protein